MTGALDSSSVIVHGTLSVSGTGTIANNNSNMLKMSLGAADPRAPSKKNIYIVYRTSEFDQTSKVLQQVGIGSVLFEMPEMLLYKTKLPTMLQRTTSFVDPLDRKQVDKNGNIRSHKSMSIHVTCILHKKVFGISKAYYVRTYEISHGYLFVACKVNLCCPRV